MPPLTHFIDTTDMDSKVKQMIKLIEEDADSFARRAEMYYKKRPELMKLVEEFYRAYRALAERYDHATGVIRQAHTTMSEAFPNQAQFALGDDSPAGTVVDGDPHTPDLPSIRAFVDHDDLDKDDSGVSPSQYYTARRSGGFIDESDSFVSKKGVKHFNDLLGSGEGMGRVRKGLNFQDVGDKDKNNGGHDRVAIAELEISTLKNALAKLEAEKEADLRQYQQSMEKLTNLESEVSRAREDSFGLNDRACRAEAEVQTLKENLTKFETEKETIFLQYQHCQDKIISLEKNVSCAEQNMGELNERASKAENEAHSLKEDVARLDAEKEDSIVQYKQCLERISELESKLLQAGEDARTFRNRAEKAEEEVERLKLELTKLSEENEAIAVRFQQCLDTIQTLEHKLACAEEETQRLNSVIDDGISKLKGAEEKCSILERSNQTMHSDLESLLQTMAVQNEEIKEKQMELGRLWGCVQEEHSRFVEAETAFQTLQQLHSQSQEELRSLGAELHNRVQILEDLEARNHSLETEVRKAEVENKNLSEVNLSSALTIQNLNDEMSSLRELIGKLESEIELRVNQRNALQQEIYCLKEELNEINKNHRGIMEQVESVGLHPECFSSSVKDLQNDNAKLKEACESNASEKLELLGKLEVMENLVEKNTFLENSLSDLNVELEGARETMRKLENTCQSLMGEKYVLVSEKTALISQLETVTNTSEKLMEENTILETSLLDANAELEKLRQKANRLEELCLLLENQKSDLATAKASLTSQLEDHERSYGNLVERHSSLENEKLSMLHKVKELQVCLETEKQQHVAFAHHSESQINSLQEEAKLKKKDFEEEIDKVIKAEIEIFVLQRCIQDLEENNSSLLLECQNLLNASKRSEKLILELEHEKLERKEEVKCLSDQLQTLRLGIYRSSKIFGLDISLWETDEAGLLNQVVNKLEETQNLLFKTQEENQQLSIEKFVFVTLLAELQSELANLVIKKNSVDQKLKTSTEQLLVLKSEGQKLTELNEQLTLNGEQREIALSAELNAVHAKLSELQEAYRKVEKENCNLSCEHKSLEEEMCGVMSQTVYETTLSLIFKSVIGEKFVEIKLLYDKLDEAVNCNNALNERVKILEVKLDELVMLGDEKEVLHQKELEGLKSKYEEVEAIKASQEKQLIKLSGDYDEQSREVKCINGVKNELESEISKLRGDLVEIKNREIFLNEELGKARTEAELWESEAAVFLGEMQSSAVREELFGGKVHELIEVCKSFEERIFSTEKDLSQLKERVSTLESENGDLNGKMSACIPAFVALMDSVASLENHALSNTTTLSQGEMEQAEFQDAPSQLQEESLGEETNKDQRSMFLDLQELQKRIRAIENAVKEKERLITLENTTANTKLEAAMREIEELKSGSSMAAEGGKPVVNPKAGARSKSIDLRMQKRTRGISDGSEVMTKDIILDQVSESGSIRRYPSVETREIWEAADDDGSIDMTVGKSHKMSSGRKNHSSRDHPSAESIQFEKEVSVDKLQISRRFSGSFSQDATSERKILERLDSDAQKLTNLQIVVQDLKRKVGVDEKGKKVKGIEYENVKEQLDESEESIMKLFDLNRKMMKNVENESSTSSLSALDDEKAAARKRKIFEHARRGSEKIGRLQLELQKLQFLLLKLDDEENKSGRGKPRAPERNASVLLRDYLYGGTRLTPKNKKKSHFCSCMQQPATRGD
ncbi:unnamed protein product [Linum tenue]|uniref:NAB domain-containing protein n=1 Tax=Linum tenue TaxID=586396 RepID=A0AAV0LIA2_9ROSI|nr:unnamed protein product [Linum tenue]